MSITENPLSGPQPTLQAPQPAPQPARDPVWTGWDVVMILLLVVGGTGFLFWILAGFQIAIWHTRPTSLHGTLRLVLIAQSITYLFVLLFMWYVVAVRYGARFGQAVRWHFPTANWFTWMAAGVMMAFGVQLLSTLLPIPRTLPIDRYFQSRGAAYMMSFFGVSLAPLVEELFFRGFLYPVLARRLGMAAGVVLTAAGFAFMHASQLASAWAPLLMLFLVGLVLTMVRVLKNAVGPTYLMHVGYNLTLFTLLYIATDHFRHMEKLIQR